MLVRIQKNERKGGFMTRLDSGNGKIAFPDREYEIPIEVEANQWWYIEITIEKEKVAFFRFIESREARIEKEKAEKHQEALKLLENALQEFPKDEKILWLAREIEKGRQTRPEEINRFLDRARIDLQRKKEAPAVMEFLQNWNEPEPEKPKYKNPWALDIKAKVIDNIQVVISWEGDDMPRGYNDDNIRTATEPANEWQIIEELPFDLIKKWPEKPVYKKRIKIRGKHIPVGETRRISLDEVLENFTKIASPYDEAKRLHNIWAGKKFIQEKARMIEGRIYIPCVDPDGFPELVELTLENPFPPEAGLIVSWEDYNSMIEGLKEIES